MNRRMRIFVWGAEIVLLVTVVVLGTYLRSQKQQSRSAEITQCQENQPSSQSHVAKTYKDESVTDLFDIPKKASVSLDNESPLSAPVKALLGLDGAKLNYNSLGKEIGVLSKDLTSDDVAALREMLTWPNDRFPEGMRAIEVNAVKNDVLDCLLQQNELPDGIGLQIVEMASDPGNDPVWRDYCVQFMTPYYERAAAEVVLTTENTEQDGIQTSVSSSEAGGEKSELELVHDAMFQALDERDSTIAGTALIGLENLSRTHDEFDREGILTAATDMALDESASSSCRVTALRVAAEAGIADDAEYTESTAEAARLLAQTGETVLLRSAAMVTLGETGSEADRELLLSFTADPNQQIASAAQLALEKLDAPQEPAVDLSAPPPATDATAMQPPKKEAPILIN